MELFTVRKENIDFDKLTTTDLHIVSFKRSVLDKYTDQSLYEIQLSENAGTLQSKNNGWVLQIDVGEFHVSTLLYKLQSLPQAEKDHFEANNIYPKELGSAAYRRWVEGKP